jgi:DNA-binding transcriptional regulator GbsR (MarR family)
MFNIEHLPKEACRKICCVGGGRLVQENKERWRELCEQAEKEQDPQKLMELVREINRLLAAKRNRLEHLKEPSR